MKKFYSLFLALMFYVPINSQNCIVICNGDFDTQYVTTGVALITSLNCWGTEATDNTFEIWGTGFQGVPSYNGIQFMELNATQGATIYQDFVAAGGTPLAIAFAHRGRAGMDSMQVSIGPVGGPYTSLGKWGDGTAAWGYYTTNYTTTNSGTHRLRFTPVYWSGGNIAIGNFLDAVSVKGSFPLNIASNSPSVCSGGALTLTATGAVNYTWTGGPFTATCVVNPQSTSVYTVLGIDSNSCTGSQTVQVTVFPAPFITAMSNRAQICRNDQPAIMTASGAVSYTWTGGIVSPTIASGAKTATFTVTGTDANGCIGTAKAYVEVNACTGLEENNTADQLIVYPNPAKDIVKVVSPVVIHLVLLNTLGQTIKEVHLVADHAASIDFSGYPPGVYFLTGADGTTRISKKIVVQ